MLSIRGFLHVLEDTNTECKARSTEIHELFQGDARSQRLVANKDTFDGNPSGFVIYVLEGQVERT
ncbi:MAG: hypothetical protein GY854_31855 [Deltaproteobacteria bacterium]|nr:hypothetical protein [Deltaproteobacteria bacterium]